jgi:hypothetical protein
MINSKMEYESTKEWIERFERQLNTPLPENDPIDPRARKIERDAIISMIESLRRELTEYEAQHQPSLVGADRK